MTQIAIPHVGTVALSKENGRGVAIVVCVSEFPESLVSDSKPRVSRLRTRLSLGLGLESMALTRLGLGLGLVNTFYAVFSSKLG